MTPKGFGGTGSGISAWPIVARDTGERVSDVRVVRAEGDALTRGRVIGCELSDIIQRSIGFYHMYFERRGFSSQQLADMLAPYLDAAQAAVPELVDMMMGMAEAADVPLMDVFAVNAFEELEPLVELPEGDPSPSGGGENTWSKPDRCSSLCLSGPGYTIVGHNEQWLAGDMGNVAVVIELPGDGGTATASPTYACCLPATGVNSHAVALGIQSVTASDEGVGVPRVLVSRHALESAGRADALSRTALPGRSGGYGYCFAARGGDTFRIETTTERQVVFDGPGVHTNHYLDPDLVRLSPEPSAGSRGRLERLTQLIDERTPDTPEAVMEILSDHGAGSQPLCVHPDPDEGDEADAVVFSAVFELESGRMWVAPGLPCQTGYEEVALTGVLD